MGKTGKDGEEECMSLASLLDDMRSHQYNSEKRAAALGSKGMPGRRVFLPFIQVHAGWVDWATVLSDLPSL